MGSNWLVQKPSSIDEMVIGEVVDRAVNRGEFLECFHLCSGVEQGPP